MVSTPIIWRISIVNMLIQQVLNMHEALLDASACILHWPKAFLFATVFSQLSI